MKIKPEEYQKMYKKSSQKSPILKDCFLAFIFGGLICTIGQAFFDFYTKKLGIPEKEALSWVSISLVFIGSFLTSINVYGKIAKYAGAGTLVPITGFANSVVAPAIEFKSEGLVLGTSSRIFTIAGPVLVYGIVSSTIYAIILYICKMFHNWYY